MANNKAAFTDLIQKEFNPTLLKHAVASLQLYGLCKKETLKPHTGTDSIRFFRRMAADLSALGAPGELTEGTTPGADRDIQFEKIDVALKQYGQVSKVTDVASTVTIVDIVKSGIELMGEEAGLYVDGLIRAKLIHPTTGLQKRYAAGAANFAALSALTNAQAVLTPRDLLDAATKLEANRAPKINGFYVAVIPPEVARDIKNNAEWREMIRTEYSDKYFKGEIGEIHGVRLVVHTNPHRETSGGTEGTYAAAGTIFSVPVMGADAVGVADLANLGGTAMKPRVIVLKDADKADRLGQYTSIGWKLYFGTEVLNPAYGQVIRCKTEFPG